MNTRARWGKFHALSSLGSKEMKLENVAPFGIAKQSSISEWSNSRGAYALLDNAEDLDFALHTDREHRPWVWIDLKISYPVHSIIIRNRRDGFQELAKTLSVEVSSDGSDWTLAHAGSLHFGHGDDSPPLVIPFSSKVFIRYIRLMLHEYSYLHLHSLEVLVNSSYARLSEVRTLYNLRCPGVLDLGSYPPEIYEVIGRNSTAENLGLIGVDINSNGAFENSVLQYVTALQFCIQNGLKYIRVSNSGLISISERFESFGVTFLPADAELPAEGSFLRGFFFNRSFFNLDDRFNNHDEQHQLITGPILRLLENKIRFRSLKKKENSVGIHVRSGDIFSTWVHPSYVQPPLAFYQMVINRLKQRYAITSVLLVFEDRRNPVIDVLEIWLEKVGLEVRTQSSSVEEDIAALSEQDHLVFGIGTFGPAVTQLAGECKSVHYYEIEGLPSFPRLPNVGVATAVVDKEGMYIKAGEWANSPAQREMMVNYAEENLKFID